MISFTDKNDYELYLNNGYFTRDLLSAAEIKTLTQQIDVTNIDLKQQFFTSTCVKDNSFRLKWLHIINDIVSNDKINTICSGYSKFYSNLLYKKRGDKGEVVVHTDWSITDETSLLPMQIWIPLVDVSIANGTLGVVKGSHRVTNKYRGFGVKEYYMDYQQEIKENCITYFELKAGQALFYHPGLIHYSPPNRSKDDRPALLVSLYPTEMNPVLYYKQKSIFNFSGKIQVYKLTEDFFTSWDKQSPPRQLNKIYTVIEPTQTQLSKDLFLNRFSR